MIRSLYRTLTSSFKAPALRAFSCSSCASGLGMFCYQCEQTRGGKFCSVPKGVCGKTPEVSALQEMILELGKRTATYAYLGRALGHKSVDVDRWILEAFFSTLTNVNFDPPRFGRYIEDGTKALKSAREGYFAACKSSNMTPEAVKEGDWEFKPSLETLMHEGRFYGLEKQREKADWEVISTKELAQYGIKGGAAYLHHAMRLGYEDQKLYEEMERVVAKLRDDMSLDEAVKLALDVGGWNYGVMELLDRANTGTFGKQQITRVLTTPVKGKCIVVSGHDLQDMYLVLKQTEGKNINVYSHGEMLPCNAYPGLKKFKHFVGNYGGAWQRQKEEFEKFPGSILMTTNCLMGPRESYKGRLFTRAVVGWPDVPHIEGDDMSKLIADAEAEPGFKEDVLPKKEILVGFGRDTILGLAPVIIDAVKDGAIKHFFLVGGCDGHELERMYYTDFARLVPKDCVILTLACGKYRFNMMNLGEIDYKGNKIPRVLDVGQCNDSYSAIVVAKALSEAFKVPINDLPLSFVLSWFEQKAVAVFLTLLHLGVKNMLLGPNMPAFVTPSVMKVLATSYNLRRITTPEADLDYLLHHKPQ